MVPLYFVKIALVAEIFAYVVVAQDGKQTSAAPLSDFLNTVRAPKIGYAPGVHQAVTNTGAQPNPANVFPGLGSPNGNRQTVLPERPFQAFEGIAQAGQSALVGLAQAGGQLFNAALQPFQQLAQEAEGNQNLD
ncbi:hypothetical protein BIW11_05495 [Tropilaelaps mercedesae]|uniref:Uncharacterized protein n=1 Tax=Tropilaelaps mercedesae TaxID=418985 RepID=A0A1V9Y220_9ACAR|nr:hypothetical protein BIW11_05495 [Tropilaelaps mercedesae]